MRNVFLKIIFLLFIFQLVFFIIGSEKCVLAKTNIVNVHNTQSSYLNLSYKLIEILKNKDMDSLSNYVHPIKGLRFSPYGHIDSEKSQVFTVTQVSKLNQDNKIYDWGYYDGSGEPMLLNFNSYYKRFIYDKDYMNPHYIGNNNSLSKGNTQNNIDVIFPNSKFVEFHFTGFNKDFQGLDWRSLRLVFNILNGSWYLVGIVHDEWTI